MLNIKILKLRNQNLCLICLYVKLHGQPTSTVNYRLIIIKVARFVLAKKIKLSVAKQAISKWPMREEGLRAIVYKLFITKTDCTILKINI